MFEKVLRQCTNELFRLGEQITKQKEASSRIAEVFQTMGSTNEASRARSRNTCMQEFDQVLDSIEFIQDEISETNQALDRPIGSAQGQDDAGLDDDDLLLAELDEMEARDLDDDVLETNQALGRPFGFAQELNADNLFAQVNEMQAKALDDELDELLEEEIEELEELGSL